MSSTQSPADNGPTWQKQIQPDGKFVRRDAQFRHWISKEEEAEYPPEAGRYHLYVSLACPWAHRTLILRALKGLEESITVDVSDWLLPARGWTFRAKDQGSTLDTVGGLTFLREVYESTAPGYQGAVTVPTLWDKASSRIVNNESSEIIRMLNSEFNEFATKPSYDFYPEELRSEIDAINSWVYPQINNGVYRSGFARSQKAYEAAVTEVFDGLDRVEGLLEERRYLLGGRLTEADIRLWTTLIRFDAVYHTHFKCNLRRLADYPNLWGYTRELYSHPAFHGTTNFAHIKHHYFESHESLNPFKIVPLGPKLDYEAPHGRDRLPASWFPEV